MLYDVDRIPMLAQSFGFACEIQEDRAQGPAAPMYTEADTSSATEAAPSCASTSTNADAHDDAHDALLSQSSRDEVHARPSKVALTLASELCKTIDGLDSQSLSRFSRIHARAMGTAAIRVVDELLQRLPNVGNVIEFAPHASLTVARGILATSRTHYGSITEYVGSPPMGPRRTVGAKGVQTIIINARRTYKFVEMYVDFVTAMITKNLSIFAIIILDGGARITCEKFSVLTREINVREGVCVTILSGSEKKITSVLDVIYV
ncbi:MAG: hypothetical protein WC440_00455 [Candidatus Omnitrophota bacterium]